MKPTDHPLAHSGTDNGDGDGPLVSFLEPDQLVLDKAQPVPRAPLSTRAKVGLWLLRIFVLVVSAMVIYTFFSQLGS